MIENRYTANGRVSGPEVKRTEYREMSGYDQRLAFFFSDLYRDSALDTLRMFHRGRWWQHTTPVSPTVPLAPGAY